jgi:hypothetical protein
MTPYHSDKTRFIAASFLFFAFTVEAAVGSDVVEIAPGEVACQRFFGFGVEWDCYAHDAYQLNEQDYALIKERIAWMRLPVARVMMLCQWCCRENGKFDFENPNMLRLYRLLDILQQQGTNVILTDWGVGLPWLKAEGIRDAQDPHYARAIATYLDHLVNNKGFRCIRSFVMGNEPDLELRDYEFWKQAVHSVAAELEKSGLDKQIYFAGTGQTEITLRNDWHRPAVYDLDGVFAFFTAHTYPHFELVRDGKLESVLRQFREAPYSDHPDLKRKPLIITESGVIGFGGSHKGNNAIGRREYGLDMADLAIQTAASGADGILAWMLDDNSHQDFYWGMWANKQQGMELRPWFYPWALFCRFVPDGSTVIRAAELPDGIRAIVARTSQEKTDAEVGWTYCIVNRNDSEVKVRLKAPQARPLRLQQFVYELKENSADASGLPLPINSEEANLEAGHEIKCPPSSLTVVTSIR